MKRHYEKIITLCCFLFLFTDIGLPSTSFNVYQPYIVAVPGVGDTGGSMVVALRTLMSVFCMLFVDRYYQALNCRRGVLVAMLSTALGFLIYSLADGLGLYLLGAAFTGIGYGLGGMVAMTLLTHRWYESGLGTAVGIASVGSGVASIVIPLIAVQIIHNFSLSLSFRLEALLALVLGVIVYALVRNYPSDIGAEPYRSDKPEAEEKKSSGNPLGIKLPPRTYHVLMVAMLCLGGVSMGGLTYLSVLMINEGIDPVFAATLLSVSGTCLALSKFLTGELFDKLGTVRGSALMFAVAIAGLTCCVLIPVGGVGCAVAGAALSGTGLALGTVGISVWSMELANPNNYAKSIKNFQLAYVIGGFVLNTMPGPLKDLTGTYVTAYALMLTMCVVSAVIVLAVYRRYVTPQLKAQASADRANTAA
jgi:MFS family permease